MSKTNASFRSLGLILLGVVLFARGGLIGALCGRARADA